MKRVVTVLFGIVLVCTNGWFSSSWGNTSIPSIAPDNLIELTAGNLPTDELIYVVCVALSNEDCDSGRMGLTYSSMKHPHLFNWEINVQSQELISSHTLEAMQFSSGNGLSQLQGYEGNSVESSEPRSTVSFSVPHLSDSFWGNYVYISVKTCPLVSESFSKSVKGKKIQTRFSKKPNIQEIINQPFNSPGCTSYDVPRAYRLLLPPPSPVSPSPQAVIRNPVTDTTEQFEWNGGQFAHLVDHYRFCFTPHQSTTSCQETDSIFIDSISSHQLVLEGQFREALNIYSQEPLVWKVSSCPIGNAGCGTWSDPRAIELITDWKLAYRWAPIHYQDVDITGDHGVNGKADYLTGVDYDGDWNPLNNWENLENISRRDLTAKVYYSVVTTDSHHFLLYAFYHPRDWADRTPHPLTIGGIVSGGTNLDEPLTWWDEHENDMEGVLFVVRRATEVSQDVSQVYGILEGALTNFHSHFFSYIPYRLPNEGQLYEPGVADGAEVFEGTPLESFFTEFFTESIDGTLYFQRFTDDNDNRFAHPKTAQEAKGHGLKMWPQVGWNDQNFKGNDGIVYYPGLEGESPSSPDDRHVKYQLVDIFEVDGLWERKSSNPIPPLYNSNGSFLGDSGGSCGRGKFTCGKNKANPPWNWNDPDDPDTGKGHFASDPAQLVIHYFENLGYFAMEYNGNNPYIPDNE